MTVRFVKDGTSVPGEAVPWLDKLARLLKATPPGWHARLMGRASGDEKQGVAVSRAAVRDELVKRGVDAWM